jgi:uncharacterized membrane protein
MSFESARSMARVATLLIVFGMVVSPVVAVAAAFLRMPWASVIVSGLISVFSFVGYILFLAAMNRFANHYREPAIYRNVLYGVLTAIVGGVVFTLVVLGLFFASLSRIVSLGPLTPGTTSVPSAFYSVIVFLIVVWLGAFLLALIQSIFYKRAFDGLAEKSGEENFKTAGLLMLIGGALTIAFVGIFLFFVGWIVAVVGFFSMKPQKPAYSSPPQSSSSVVKRYCSKCGGENNLEAEFCSHCGNRL